MIRRAVLFLSLIPLAQAADWLQFRTGPFEVLSNAGEKEGRDTLNFLEQLRYTLGHQLGATDLQPTFPLRVLVLKKRSPVSAAPRMGRDAYIMSITEMTPDAVTAIVKLLLDGWTGQLPPPIERGLLQLYSTIDIDGTRIRVGAVPPQKDRDWARAHCSRYIRITAASCGYCSGTSAAAWIAMWPIAMRSRRVPRRSNARSTTTFRQVSIRHRPGYSKPLNPRRELVARDVEDTAAQLALADLQLALGQSEAACVLRSAPSGKTRYAGGAGRTRAGGGEGWAGGSRPAEA